jgi:hypothetical protein
MRSKTRAVRGWQTNVEGVTMTLYISSRFLGAFASLREARRMSLLQFRRDG